MTTVTNSRLNPRMGAYPVQIHQVARAGRAVMKIATAGSQEDAAMLRIWNL